MLDEVIPYSDVTGKQKTKIACMGTRCGRKAGIIAKLFETCWI